MSKTPLRVDPKKEEPTRGAKLGNELRAMSNGLSDEKRQELRSIAMALIHGGKGKCVAVRG
jgi:hypothetical protein